MKGQGERGFRYLLGGFRLKKIALPCYFARVPVVLRVNTESAVFTL